MVLEFDRGLRESVELREPLVLREPLALRALPVSLEPQAPILRQSR